VSFFLIPLVIILTPAVLGALILSAALYAAILMGLWGIVKAFFKGL